jgi:hypothetical protein
VVSSTVLLLVGDLSCSGCAAPRQRFEVPRRRGAAVPPHSRAPGRDLRPADPETRPRGRQDSRFRRARTFWSVRQEDVSRGERGGFLGALRTPSRGRCGFLGAGSPSWRLETLFPERLRRTTHLRSSSSLSTSQPAFSSAEKEKGGRFGWLPAGSRPVPFRGIAAGTRRTRPRRGRAVLFGAAGPHQSSWISRRRPGSKDRPRGGPREGGGSPPTRQRVERAARPPPVRVPVRLLPPGRGAAPGREGGG